MAENAFFNKNVLISGGSSGIGLSLAKDFVKFGANVTILARNKDRLKSALTELDKNRLHSSQIFNAITCDVTDYPGLKRELQGFSCDVLINSAGIAYPGKFEHLDQKIFVQVVNINYLGTVNLTKVIVPNMIKQKSGYIVNISSLAAIIGIYGYTAYAPSKYAVRGFSRCLRAELKPYGINVSVALPPDTDTPQLVFEKGLLPDITKQINEKGGVLSPESVSKSIIRGMRRKKFTIIPGFEGKLLYILAPIFGRYFYHFAVNKSKQKIT